MNYNNQIDSQNIAIQVVCLQHTNIHASASLTKKRQVLKLDQMAIHYVWHSSLERRVLTKKVSKSFVITCGTDYMKEIEKP